jgi:hypothetical protein
MGKLDELKTAYPGVDFSLLRELPDGRLTATTYFDRYGPHNRPSPVVTSHETMFQPAGQTLASENPFAVDATSQCSDGKQLP